MDDQSSRRRSVRESAAATRRGRRRSSETREDEGEGETSYRRARRRLSFTGNQFVIHYGPLDDTNEITLPVVPIQDVDDSQARRTSGPRGNRRRRGLSALSSTNVDAHNVHLSTPIEDDVNRTGEESGRKRSPRAKKKSSDVSTKSPRKRKGKKSSASKLDIPTAGMPCQSAPEDGESVSDNAADEESRRRSLSDEEYKRNKNKMSSQSSKGNVWGWLPSWLRRGGAAQTTTSTDSSAYRRRSDQIQSEEFKSAAAGASTSMQHRQSSAGRIKIQSTASFLHDQEHFNQFVFPRLPPDFDLSAWMDSDHIRSLSIWDVCLPATHNSASWKLDFTARRTLGMFSSVVSFFAQCQSLSILEQLNCGVRFLDLRVCKGVGDVHQMEPFCAHGGIRTVSLRKVFTQIRTFLEQHPSEVLILSIKKDVGFPTAPYALDAFESDFWLCLYLGNFLGAQLEENVTVGELVRREQQLIYFWDGRERYLPSAHTVRRLVEQMNTVRQDEENRRRGRASVFCTKRSSSGSDAAVAPSDDTAAALPVDYVTATSETLLDATDVRSLSDDRLSAVEGRDEDEGASQDAAAEEKIVDLWETLTGRGREEDGKGGAGGVNLRRYRYDPRTIAKDAEKIDPLSSDPVVLMGMMDEVSVPSIYRTGHSLELKEVPKVEKNRVDDESTPTEMAGAFLSEDPLFSRHLQSALREKTISSEVSKDVLLLLRQTSALSVELGRRQTLPPDISFPTVVSPQQKRKKRRLRIARSLEGMETRREEKPVMPLRRGASLDERRPSDPDMPKVRDWFRQTIASHVDAADWPMASAADFTPGRRDGLVGSSEFVDFTRDELPPLRMPPQWGTHTSQQLKISRSVPTRLSFSSSVGGGEGKYAVVGSRYHPLSAGIPRGVEIPSAVPKKKRKPPSGTVPHPPISPPTFPSDIVVVAGEETPWEKVRCREGQTEASKVSSSSLLAPPASPGPSDVSSSAGGRRRISSLIRTPFMLGKSRIVKSWSLTCDPSPPRLCDKLTWWGTKYGQMPPRDPYCFRVLAGEVTAATFDASDGSPMEVVRYWTRQTAALCLFMPVGLRSAAEETHRILLGRTLNRDLISNVNVITHDFANVDIARRVVSANFAIASLSSRMLTLKHLPTLPQIRGSRDSEDRTFKEEEIMARWIDG